MRKPKIGLQHGGKVSTVLVEFEVEAPRKLNAADAKKIEAEMRGEFSMKVVDVVYWALRDTRNLWVHTEDEPSYDTPAVNTLRVRIGGAK